MGRGKSQGQKPSAKKKSRAKATPKPISFNVEEIATDSWLDDLPLGTFGRGKREDVMDRRPFAGMTDPALLTHVIFRITTTQSMMLRSLAGSPDSAKRTDGYSIAGKKRFTGSNTALRGVVSKICSHEVLRDPSDCSGNGGKNGQCGECFHCRVFGFMDRANQSRVQFSNLGSEEAYQPVLVQTINTSGDRYFSPVAEHIPVGTHFWFTMTLRNPSRVELATLIEAVKWVGQSAGLGSRTTTYGKFKSEVMAFLGGSVATLADSESFIELTDQGMDPAQAVESFVEAIPHSCKTIIGDEAARVADAISRLTPISPMFGEPII